MQVRTKAILGTVGGVVAAAGLSTACFVKGKASGRKQGYETGRQNGMEAAYQIYKKNIEPLGPKITTKGEIVDEPNNRSVFRIDVGLADRHITEELKETGFVPPKGAS